MTSIENNHVKVESLRKGGSGAIKIEQRKNVQEYMVGRHFDEKDELVSKVCFIGGGGC